MSSTVMSRTLGLSWPPAAGSPPRTIAEAAHRNAAFIRIITAAPGTSGQLAWPVRNRIAARGGVHWTGRSVPTYPFEGPLTMIEPPRPARRNDEDILGR